MKLGLLPAFMRKIGEDYMEEIRIQGSLGSIYGVLKMPSGKEKAPLVILSHGFGSDHNRLMDHADYYCSRGLAAYAFDFCGGGYGSRSDGTMLEMTVLTEAEDLNAVIDYFKKDSRFSEIFLMGGSQGGFVSAYVSAMRPEDIRGIVLEFPAIVLQDDARRRANPDGSFPETSTVMGNTISRKYNEAAIAFDLYDMMPAYSGKVLILHGDQDPIVPLSYSERAKDAYPNASLVVLPGEKHGFQGAALRKAQEMETAFFKSLIQD